MRLIVIVLSVAIVGALSACTLPGKPGPIPGATECRLRAHGLACSEVPYGPEPSGIVVYE